MKGDLILKILEHVAEVAGDMTDLLEVFLSAGYGAPGWKMERMLREKNIERSRSKREFDQKQRYWDAVYRLKRDGLLAEKTKQRGKILHLTGKGREKLKALRDKKSGAHGKEYKMETSNAFTIISFDIPERERRKRDWLRTTLHKGGFSVLHKSVFIGKIKVSEEFLEDLRKFDLMDCVKIFEITKTGTLEVLG